MITFVGFKRKTQPGQLEKGHFGSGVGSAFAYPIKLLKIVNLTNANLIVSYDGVNNQDIVTANGGCIYDVAANKADPAGTFQLSVGDRVYVMEETSAPTSGNVYVVVVYASEN